MRVDWIVAVFIFLMFTSWAFSYYSLLGTGRMVSLSQSAIADGGKVERFFRTELVTIPANFSSNGTGLNSTLWAWLGPGGSGANTTRVTLSRLSGSSLPCMVSGDRIFWKADASAGGNVFFIGSSEADSAAGCGSAIAEALQNETTLWAGESTPAYSAALAAQSCALINSSGDGGKALTGSAFSFRAVAVMPSGNLTCGPPPPATGRDIFVHRASGMMLDGGMMSLKVTLWQ